jgi:hypothetical protein
MDDQLSGAWSVTKDGFLASTEVMEKCLLWAANNTWNEDRKGTVEPRVFASLSRDSFGSRARDNHHSPYVVYGIHRRKAYGYQPEIERKNHIGYFMGKGTMPPASRHIN